MKRSITIIVFGLFLISTPLSSAAQDTDLFETAKSDTNIKRFVFPKSMTVVQNCVSNDICLFGISDSHPDRSNWNQIFSNRERAKRILRKADAARVAPVKNGEKLIGLVEQNQLGAIGKKYSTDFLLVYRIRYNQTDDSAYFKFQGLLYLVRQNKILILPFNKQTAGVQKLNAEEVYRAGLQQLAKDTGRVIHAHQYEKLQSAY